jgi:hypothetical protein
LGVDVAVNQQQEDRQLVAELREASSTEAATRNNDLHTAAND